MPNLLTHDWTTRDGSSVLLKWTADDHAAALRQGWFLDLDDGALQHDPDQDVFTSPLAVHDHLRALARCNEQLAIKALAFDAIAAVDAWCAAITGE